MANKVSLVCGFGVNDADYQTQSSAGGSTIVCPAFSAWRCMLMRCYCKKFQDKHKSYSGVTVCDEWRSFMKFREWWLDNHVDGWELDKDILTDQNVYSPSTCVYVPSWLNRFVTKAKSSAGVRQAGVSHEKISGKFRAQCRNPITRKNEYIGMFESQSEASAAWLNKKLGFALELRSEMDKIDCRIYQRVVSILSKDQQRLSKCQN